MWRFRRLVNRYVNPITRPVAKKLPAFAVLTHAGRKTGRTYQTPINVFRQGDDYFFFLTYGSDVQKYNVLAAGSCSIETRGRVVELVEPELITDPELTPSPRLTSASSSGGSPASRSTCGCTPHEQPAARTWRIVGGMKPRKTAAGHGPKAACADG